MIEVVILKRESPGTSPAECQSVCDYFRNVWRAQKRSLLRVHVLSMYIYVYLGAKLFTCLNHCLEVKGFSFSCPKFAPSRELKI